MKNFEQGDIVWINFSPSFDNEMRGKHPAVVVSNSGYNRSTGYFIVCPITSHGNDFPTYIPLKDYHGIHGRINAAQVHSFSKKRVLSIEKVDRLRTEDMMKVKQILDYSLEMSDY